MDIFGLLVPGVSTTTDYRVVMTVFYVAVMQLISLLSPLEDLMKGG